MTPDTFFDLFIRGSYLALAGITLADLLRHRSAARFDIALPFVALAIPTLTSVIRDWTGYQEPWINLISSLMLLPQPYFFMRLLKHFMDVPVWAERLTIAGVILSCLGLILSPTPLPLPVSLPIVIYFVLAQTYTVVMFVVGATHTRGVTRSQLLLVAMGSGFFALIILLAGIGIVIPRLVPTGPVTRIIALLSALSYYLGFASPRWLRQVWQRTELHRFLHGMDDIQHIDQRSEAIDYLCQFAIQTVGGQSASVALWDTQKQSLVIQGEEGDVLLPSGQNDAIGQVWREKKPVAAMSRELFGEECRKRADAANAHALYAVPMIFAGHAQGMLLVFLRGALFPQDDLEVLRLLAAQVSRNLRYLDLIESLRVEQELMQALMNNIPDTIYFKDAESRFTRINPAQMRVLGVESADQALGKTDLDFQSSESAQEFLKEEQELVRTGKPIINRIEYNPLPNGDPRWFSATKVPLTDPSGAVIGIIGISRNITQAKLDEARINDLNKSLTERADELEGANKELSAFSYSVSHDLRAPLRTIDGFSRILQEDFATQLPPDGQRYLGLVREGAQQMGRLIDDLLAFSRLGRQPIKFIPVRPEDLVSQVLDSLAEDRNGRQVDIRIGDLPECNADPALIRQVYANLLANALKFTRLRNPAVIEIGCNTTGSEHVYYVRDNGAGFDMKYSDKLFGVFQRLHRAEDYEGTGVGLATVQRIVHRHGGRIWAEAEIDKGAAFYFTLRGDHVHV